jgi:hypothetical protein
MNRHQLTRLALVAAVVAAFSSCASTPAGPGDGDISFRLTWTGNADLDLYVVSPLGERVDFTTRKVGSGGSLDVDCNVRNNKCPAPMENVFWERHMAPQGEYRYAVNDATEEGVVPDAGAWVLEVRVLGRVVKQHSGTTASLKRSIFQEKITFTRKVR